MTLEIDLAGLSRYWNLDGGSLPFVLDVEWFGSGPDLEDLEEIAAGVAEGHSSHDGDEPVRVTSWLRSASGWCAVMVGAFTIDDGLEWFERFGAALGGAVTGTVTGGPKPSRTPARSTAPAITAYVAFRTGDLTRVPSDDRDALWYVDAGTTRRVAEESWAWAHLRGGRDYLYRAMSYIELEPHPDNASGIATSIGHGSHVAYISTHGRTAARTAAFTAQGRTLFQATGEDAWPELVEVVQRALLWLPEATDLGFIRYARGSIQNWSQPTVPWPSATEPDVRYTRPLLASFVPDVSGIQLLTDAHLTRAGDLSGWSVGEVAPGKHLVVARDLEPWLSRPEPDPRVLADARRNFSGMILTPDIVAEHTPWTDGPYAPEHLPRY